MNFVGMSNNRVFTGVVGVLIAFMVFTSTMSTAQASEVPQTTVQPVYMTHKSGHDLNQVCPDRAKTVFVVDVKVPKGTRIVNFSQFVLTLRKGNYKTDVGYLLNKRTVEYYIYTAGKARVDLAHPKHSFAESIEWTGTNVLDPEVHVVRACVAE